MDTSGVAEMCLSNQISTWIASKYLHFVAIDANENQKSWKDLVFFGKKKINNLKVHDYLLMPEYRDIDI